LFSTIAAISPFPRTPETPVVSMSPAASCCVLLLVTMVLGDDPMVCSSVMQLATSLKPRGKDLAQTNWEHGSAAWREARASVAGNRTGLWYKPNACDSDVLHASAPLTVLFSVTLFWQEIQARRATVGSTSKPLEVHVLGASYPFEGRANWALLSKSRPPHVPGVRVVLVLGTPFQSDNVPPLANTPNSLLQLQEQRKQPAAGRWNDRLSEIVCNGDGKWGTRVIDQGWSKAELCRDHGNGLEVVCLEEYYSDAKKKLPRPDMAVLFSPGFPQLERRSWDAELRWMLADAVPIMVSDIIIRPDWGRVVQQSGQLVPHGAEWDVDNDEPEMTLSTMRNYGARTLGAFRGPSPIIHAEHSNVMAKNAIVQMFQGYGPAQLPIPPPSPEDIAVDTPFLEKVDWAGLRIWHGLERSLKTAVSKPYDRACQEFYAPQIRELAEVEGLCTSLAQGTIARLRDLGLCGAAGKPGHQSTSTQWTVKDWIFIIEVLNVNGSVFDVI